MHVPLHPPVLIFLSFRRRSWAGSSRFWAWRVLRELEQRPAVSFGGSAAVLNWRRVDLDWILKGIFYVEDSEAAEQAAQRNCGSLEVFKGRLDRGFSNLIHWKTSLPMGWWTTRSLGRSLPPTPMVKRHRRHTEVLRSRKWHEFGLAKVLALTPALC